MNGNSLDDIKRLIKICLKKLYAEDAVLFSRNEGKGLCERCIVFRLGHYLQDAFQDYFVDCDFNSSSVRGQQQSGKSITNAGGRTSTKRFIDIIVHTRTFDNNNDFICLEIKKWNNYDRRAFDKDVNNLKVLTTQYRYKYGFYLTLGKTVVQTKWLIFQDGEIVENETLIFKQQEV